MSLFADMTYEGARSISGQYLAILGATGFAVGMVAGFGELIGYGFRLISGYISDKSGKYWLVTFIGFAVNLLAVPLLALAGNWPLAASLMIFERFGKSIRTPARDAMLSYATKETGRGWGFGLHEAMDQVGAITGPLIVSCILYYQGSYQMSFAILLIPALCALCVLVCARMLYPRPQDLEIAHPSLKTEGFNKKYWLYLAAICCVAAGYVDFALIAFHFKKSAVMSDAWMPVIFAISMGAAGVAALIFGRLYDTKGFSVLIFATALAAFFAPLVFLGNFYSALAGMILWGIGLGSQESIMRAVVANLVQMNKRGTAYGVFNIWFGVFWFLGSALMGFLYDVSLVSLILFSISIQFAAIPLLFAVKRA
ncbi:MAG: MFS transporter [Chlamydiales bacterium]